MRIHPWAYPAFVAGGYYGGAGRPWYFAKADKQLRFADAFRIYLASSMGLSDAVNNPARPSSRALPPLLHELKILPIIVAGFGRNESLAVVSHLKSVPVLSAPERDYQPGKGSKGTGPIKSFYQ